MTGAALTNLRAPTSTSRWHTNLHGFWILNKSVTLLPTFREQSNAPITFREHAVHAVHETARRFERRLLDSPLTSL